MVQNRYHKTSFVLKFMSLSGSLSFKFQVAMRVPKTQTCLKLSVPETQVR